VDAKIIDLMYDKAFELFEQYLKEGDSINVSKKKSGLTSLLSKKLYKRNIITDIRYIRLKAFYNQTTKQHNRSWIPRDLKPVDFALPDGRLKNNELPLNSPIRQKQIAENNFLKLQLEIEKKIETRTPNENVDILPVGFMANMTLKP